MTITSARPPDTSIAPPRPATTPAPADGDEPDQARDVIPGRPRRPAPRRARLSGRSLAAVPRWTVWRDLACLLLLGAVTLAFFWPTISTGQVAYENDTRIFYYPLFVRLGEAFKAGLLPLWSPQLFGGYPIFADGEAGALYPLHLLMLLVLPIQAAFLWLRPLRFLQSAVFTYLFCRSLGVGRFGALVGALSFAFSGFAVAQLHHTNINTAAVWLPLTLTFGELAIRHAGRRRYTFALLAGVAFGMQGLIIHVQVVLMSAIAFGAFCAFRCANGPVGESVRGPWDRLNARRITPWPTVGRAATATTGRLALAIALVAIAGGIGAGLAAVQLLPLFELGTFSFRGGGVDYAFATQYSLPPVQLLSLLLPDFFVVNGQYWGLWSRWEVFVYCGIAPLVLTLVALPLAHRRLTWFFLVLGAISLALAFGEYSPFGIHRMLASLPGFSVLRAPGRFAFLVTLAVAMLAAFGADALRRAFGQGRDRDGALRGALVGAVLLVLQLAAMAAPLVIAGAGLYAQGHKDITVQWLQDTLQRARGFDTRYTSEQLYQFTLAALDLAQPSTIRQVALLLATVAVLITWERMRRLGRLWQSLLVALIAVDLVGWGQGFHPTVPLADLAAPSGLATFLAQNPGLYRVYTQKGTRDEPNRLLTFGITEANGYSSLPPTRHEQYSAMAEYAPNRLLDLLNVRFYAVKNVFQALPSFNLTSFNPQRPLLSSTGRNPAGINSFALNDVPADSLRIVSSLRFSLTVPQGTDMARVTAVDSEGRQYQFRLQAGINTADWAWERPDLKDKMAHQLPPPAQIARTWQQQEGKAPPFTAHFYYAEFPLGRSVKLRRVDMQFLHPTAQVDIFGVAAFDDITKDLEQLDQAKLAKLRRVYADQEMVLYENQQYLPRAFLVPSAILQRPGEEILTRMAHGDFDPEQIVILEDQFDVSRLPPPRSGPPTTGTVRFNRPIGTEITSDAGTVNILRFDEDHLRLDVAATNNAMLLLTDLMYPGWTATIDGQEAPILRADFLFRSIYVPAGRHVVEFIYRPRSFRLGLLVTLLTTAVTVAGLLALSAPRRSWILTWTGRRTAATMEVPGIAPATAGPVTADGDTSSAKGVETHGRQEPQEHRQEELAEEGGRDGQKEVATASSPLAEAAPGHSGS